MGEQGEGERCSKLFVGKPSGTTAGVEGFFTTDGVFVYGTFQVTPESAADVVDILAHILVQPCLVITDIPCKIVPIAERLFPGLLQDGGVLPRDAEGQVCLKELQHIGAHAYEFPDEHEVKVPPMGFPTAAFTLGASPVQPEQPDQPDTVYAAYAAAETAPGVQPHVDFRSLLRRAADAQDRARTVADPSSSLMRISDLAESTLNGLHKRGWYAMTLYEVVLLYYLWFQATGWATPEGEAPGAVAGAEGEGGRGGDNTPPLREISELSRSELATITSYLKGVLRVAVGLAEATEATSLSLGLPEFLTDDVLYIEVAEGGAEDDTGEEADDTGPTPVLRDLEGIVELYHERKARYITRLLGAEPDGDASERAYRLIRSGVGFGVAEHSVKALQIALSSDCVGGGVGEDGKLPGYSIDFNFKRTPSYDNYGHFYGGKRVGLWLGPDGPHEGNHQGSCQAKFGGLTRCRQITGTNCNPHEQNHSKKIKFLPSVTGMGFDTFTFNVTLINELENVKINRKTCTLAVSSASGHPRHRLPACRKEVWSCGRCFCSKPLMRSFDKLGKLCISYM
ncbi:unnamed protein product [Ectocarpus sp. CCAP 1310/34]|nr:unnamed protein product [Ectocarpus sp. CCAP 1310/34]